eukprot:TRINITY_DN704_c0_g7_i1.p1 TRINITY_DN704_c0_g7~~TRINITY_DN704_c0_g7_i1.p1  ORF type:complete len:112 (-),score=29.65 TRINITY_DN704_c0_g7_i1:322-657(-)
MEVLDQYIKDYNEENFEGIKSALAEDCSVEMNGAVVMTGREKMLPSYLDDFKEKNKCSFAKEPIVTKRDDLTGIRVVLDTSKKGIYVEVTYWINKDNLMVKHEIHAVTPKE